MSIDGAELALAMLVSISEGLCLEGLLGAILFRALADMSAAGEVSGRLVEGKAAQDAATLKSKLSEVGGCSWRPSAEMLACRCALVVRCGREQLQHRGTEDVHNINYYCLQH